jgi:toxin ParE1/3/4
MSRYVISPKAREDLKTISRYVANEGGSPAGARSLRHRFLHHFRKLASQPGMGQATPDLGASVRQWPVGNYVVYYEPSPGGVRIIRVIHGARDLPSAFRE